MQLIGQKVFDYSYFFAPFFEVFGRVEFFVVLLFSLIAAEISFVNSELKEIKQSGWDEHLFLLTYFSLSILVSYQMKTPSLITFFLLGFAFYQIFSNISFFSRFGVLKRSGISFLAASTTFLIIISTMRNNLVSMMEVNQKIDTLYRLGKFAPSKEISKALNQLPALNQAGAIQKYKYISQVLIDRGQSQAQVFNRFNFSQLIIGKKYSDIWELYKMYPVENLNFGDVYTLIEFSRRAAEDSCQKTGVRMAEKNLPEGILINMVNTPGDYMNCVGLVAGRYELQSAAYTEAVKRLRFSRNYRIRSMADVTLKINKNSKSIREVASLTPAFAIGRTILTKK